MGRPTKYDWDKILPDADNMRDKGFGYKEIAESFNIPYNTFYKKIKKHENTEGKNMRIEWGKIYSKVEKMLEQGKDKTEIAEELGVPYARLIDKIALEERKKYVKNKERGQQTIIQADNQDKQAAADPTPQESVSKKEEKEKSFKCAECGTSLDGEITTCWPRDGREAPLCLDCFRGASKKIDPPTNTNKLIKELKSLLEYAETSLKKGIPLTAHAEEEMGYFICPSCDMAVSYLNDKEEHKYCLNCGQKIKWD